MVQPVGPIGSGLYRFSFIRRQEPERVRPLMPQPVVLSVEDDYLITFLLTKGTDQLTIHGVLASLR